MPCDSIQTAQVNFNLDATDLNLLKLALEGLGYTVSQVGSKLNFYLDRKQASGTWENGKFSARVYGSADEFDVNEVKRAYSKEVVKYASKRFGWTLKETTQNKYEAQRRF